MIRSLLLAASLALLFSGCCVDRMSGRYCGPDGCYNSGRGSCGPGCSDCPYHCDNRSFLRNMLGCQNGCGEIYWNEWANDPPDCCDPCDNCGHFTGPHCCRPRTLYTGWTNLWGYRNCGGGSCGGCGSSGGCSSCGRASCGGTSCGKYGCSTCGGQGGCSTCGGGYGGEVSYGGGFHGGCSTCGGGGGQMPEGVPMPPPARMSDPFQDDPEQSAPAPAKNSRVPTPAKRQAAVGPHGAKLMTSNQPMVRPWTPVRTASLPGPQGQQGSQGTQDNQLR